MNTYVPDVVYFPPPPIEVMPKNCHYLDSYPVIYTQYTEYYLPDFNLQNDEIISYTNEEDFDEKHIEKEVVKSSCWSCFRVNHKQ